MTPFNQQNVTILLESNSGDPLHQYNEDDFSGKVKIFNKFFKLQVYKLTKRSFSFLRLVKIEIEIKSLFVLMYTMCDIYDDDWKQPLCPLLLLQTNCFMYYSWIRFNLTVEVVFNAYLIDDRNQNLIILIFYLSGLKIIQFRFII